MTPEQIRSWRPRHWSEFFGEENRSSIEWLQQLSIDRALNLSLLLVGPFGSGKTSLARHLVKSACCPNRNPETGDPCYRLANDDQRCLACSSTEPGHNGDEYGSPNWEIDGARSNRQQVLEYLREIECDIDCGPVFVDEFHRLHDRYAKEPLLKIGEDYKGLFIVSVMDTELDTVPGALRERFETVRLHVPDADEFVEFLHQKAADWRIVATDSLIRHAVESFGKSFRRCKQVFARAAASHDRTVTERMIDDVVRANRPIDPKCPEFVDPRYRNHDVLED